MDEINSLSAAQYIGLLLETQEAATTEATQKQIPDQELTQKLLGPKSEFARLAGMIKQIPAADRSSAGTVLNEVKKSILSAIAASSQKQQSAATPWFDVTSPGYPPPVGHLHLVSQAISEITRIFERIGFTRVRHPEVDWDWYPFESLNMPPHHPARDEWETFFIDTKTKNSGGKFGKMVLTPHTSNGQVREMEKGKLPIRMINIAKCYRKQSDISHSPMFHQFEGLYVDKNVSIGDLKGVCDYFFKQFYGPDRVSRLRPFHFQFTEPSFEIDVTCGVCQGSGKLKNGEKCRLCKEGWLELGGAGMVHPTVLKNGGVDPEVYNGFAFGWGVERTYMMKSGTQLDDVRLLYSNDVRFLEQF